MYRSILVLFLLILAAAPALSDGRSEIIARCPTLSRLNDAGKLGQIRHPVFTDEKSAREFAGECRKVARELETESDLPADLAELRIRAEMAGEFLMGDTYDLSKSTVPSVVKLRTWVKIAPPKGLVYVRKYNATDHVPEVVKEAFTSLGNREDRAHIEGVTIDGRYIALLNSEYHDELEDNLSHEMVHAYITLASPKPLPTWFQEGAAVYFSLGKEGKLYGKRGDPRMKQVALPEDYKTRLHSFQFIEAQIGRPKLFAFIKKSVETGEPDPRSALGLEKPEEPWRPPIALVTVVIFVVGILFGIAFLVSQRRERFD